MLLVSQPVSQYTSAKCRRNVLQGTSYKLLANYLQATSKLPPSYLQTDYKLTVSKASCKLDTSKLQTRHKLAN